MTLDELLQNCKRMGIVVAPVHRVKIGVASRILGLSVSRLNQRRAEGLPPHTVRYSGQQWYTIDELLRFINDET